METQFWLDSSRWQPVPDAGFPNQPAITPLQAGLSQPNRLTVTVKAAIHPQKTTRGEAVWRPPLGRPTRSSLRALTIAPRDLISSGWRAHVIELCPACGWGDDRFSVSDAHAAARAAAWQGAAGAHELCPAAGGGTTDRATRRLQVSAQHSEAGGGHRFVGRLAGKKWCGRSW